MYEKIATYKDWTIKIYHSGSKRSLFCVFDQNMDNHRTLYRDLKTLQDAKDYIDECIISDLKSKIRDLEEGIKIIDILLKEGWEKGTKRHKGLLINQKRFPKLLAEKKAELESLS